MKFFIDKFPDLVVITNPIYLDAPLYIFKILESKGKIDENFINTENLLSSIEGSYYGFVKWCIEKNFAVPKETSNEIRFQKGIENMLFCDINLFRLK